MNTQTIDGIEYVEEDIPGKGICLVPKPKPIDPETELTNLLLKQTSSLQFWEVGSYVGSKNHKSYAVQRRYNQYAFFIWDLGCDSYRLWTDFIVKDNLHEFLEALRLNSGISSAQILEGFKSKFLK